MKKMNAAALTAACFLFPPFLTLRRIHKNKFSVTPPPFLTVFQWIDV
jgi:hypothetical protein